MASEIVTENGLRFEIVNTTCPLTRSRLRNKIRLVATGESLRPLLAPKPQSLADLLLERLDERAAFARRFFAIPLSEAATV